MTDYNDFIYAIGDFFTWTFQIFDVLDNFPNYIFAALMAGGVIYWLNWQKQLSAEAKKNGTLE